MNSIEYAKQIEKTCAYKLMDNIDTKKDRVACVTFNSEQTPVFMFEAHEGGSIDTIKGIKRMQNNEIIAQTKSNPFNITAVARELGLHWHT